MVRRFALKKGQVHTDFRKIIADMVSTLLRAMNGEEIKSFFRMP